MRKRPVAILAAVLLVVAVVSIAAFFGSMEHIERQRVRDAEAAFGPLLSLEPLILSQPTAFRRCCRYIVEFRAYSKLSDARAGELLCLNNLPTGNSLDLVIRAPSVTDRSIAHLKSVRTLTALDVTGSSITDAGVEDLRNALPGVIVVKRDAESGPY